jgi:hypothetical protein
MLLNYVLWSFLPCYQLLHTWRNVSRFSMNFHHIMGHEVLTTVKMDGSISWDNRVVVHRRFADMYCFHLQGRRLSQVAPFAVCYCTFLAWLFDSNDGCIRSSQTSVNFHWTTRRHIPEDTSFSNRHLFTYRRKSEGSQSLSEHVVA